MRVNVDDLRGRKDILHFTGNLLGLQSPRGSYR